MPFTKSLRIVIGKTLSWKNHIEYISTKIKRSTAVHGRSNSILSKELLNMLHKTLIEPYFRYGNTVLGQCHQTLQDRLQSMQNRAARMIVGISYEEADHPSILYRLGLLRVRHLIVLDLAVAMFKVAKGILFVSRALPKRLNLFDFENWNYLTSFQRQTIEKTKEELHYFLHYVKFMKLYH